MTTLPDRLRDLADLLVHVFGGARLEQATADLWDAAQTLDEIRGNPKTNRRPRVSERTGGVHRRAGRLRS
jgi:hypothetical protein